MRSIARVLAVTTTSLLLLGVLPSQSGAAVAPAFQLVSSLPAANSFINADPTTISATFNAPLATGLTANNTISLAGPAVAGSDGATVTCTPPQTSGSTVSCRVVSGGLTDGVYKVSYSVAASTGGAPSAGSFVFTLDKTAPVAPTGLTLSPSPYKADSAGLTVTGAAEKGSTVTVALTSSAGGTTPTPATVPADATTGAFTASFSAPQVAGLNDGTLTASVTAKDAAGNTGAAATKTTTKDTVAPTLVSTAPSDGGTVRSSNGAMPPVASAYTATASQSLGTTSKIEFFSGASQLANDAPSVSGSSVSVRPSSPLVEGTYTAKITLVDASGNTTVVTRTFVISNAAPVINAAAVINNANKAAYTVSGTGGPGTTVSFMVKGGATTVTGTATVGSDGTWSKAVDVSSLPDGAVTIDATQTDSAGNTSSAAQVATTKDTVAPAAPTNITVTDPINNGNQTAVLVGGTKEANTGVTVTITDTTSPTAQTVMTSLLPDSSTTFSVPLDVTSLKDGTVTASVVTLDAAGNSSTAASKTATKDTTGPTAPTVTVTDPINNTNKSTVVVSGTKDANTSVAISISDGGSTPVTASAGTSSATTYSVSGINVSSLQDGTLTVTVTSTDAAGNVSTATVKTATKDTMAPAVPTSVVPQYVNASTVTAVPVSGTGEPGTTITVSAGDGTSTPRVAKTTPVGSDGTWATTIDLHTLADGGLSVNAIDTDAAGNATTKAGSTTKDTVAPGTPATLTTSPSAYLKAQTGSTFTVSGTTATADNSTSNLSVDLMIADTDLATSDLTFTLSPVSAPNFSHTFTAAQIASQTDGTLTVTATLRDPAGNKSATKTITLIKDTTVLTVVSMTPASSGAVTPTASVSSTYNEVLNQSTSTLTVKNKSGNAIACPTAFSADGKTISCTPSTALTDADSPYTAAIHGVDTNDAADSKDVTLTLTVDSTAPLAPGITTPAPISSANRSSYTVSGTGETDATVTVTLTNGGTTLTQAKKVASGAWSVTFDATSLTDGTVTVSASQKDLAGNTGPVTTVTVTKDTVAPSVNGLAGTNTTSTTTSTSVTGTTDTSATVALSATDGPHTVTGTATVTSDGTFSGVLDLSSLNDGMVTVSATATDAVGNVGAAATVTVMKDATAPVVSGLSATGVTASQKTTTVTGSTTSSTDTVALSAADSSHAPVTGTANVASDGSFSGSLDLSSLGDGSITISATPTDSVGNVGPAATTTVSKDGMAPVVTGLAATATNASNANSTITGTRSKTSTVELTVGDGTSTVTSTVPSGTGAFSQAVDVHTLKDGALSVTSVATDASGNTSTATTSTSKDTVAPAVTGLSATAVSSSGSSTTITGSVSEAASLVITAADPSKPVTTTVSVPAGSFSTTLDLSGLSDGPITVTALPTDAAGNAGTAATATTSKDTVAPTVTGLSATSTNASTPSSTIKGSTSEAGSVVVSATDGTTTVTGKLSGQPAGAFTTTLDLRTLVDGTITVKAIATDAAGNTGPSATTTTSKTAALPTRPTAPTATARDRSAVVSFSTTAGQTYTVTSSPGSFTATGTTSPLTVTGLTNGTAYTFTLVVKNAAGNTSTASPPSTSVTPRGASSTALNATPASLRSGTAFTLAGKVARPSSSGSFGTVILRVTFDNGSVSNLGAVAVATNGTFSKSVRVTNNGSYTATYNGDAATTGSASAARRTLAMTAITASYTAKSAAASTLVVKGSVAPNKRGVVIYLNEILSNGKTRLLAKQAINAKSAFSFSLKLPRGSHRLQLVLKATSGNAAGTSTFSLTRT